MIFEKQTPHSGVTIRSASEKICVDVKYFQRLFIIFVCDISNLFAVSNFSIFAPDVANTGMSETKNSSFGC